MAKHLVKCRICGKEFDTNTEPTFQKGRWYAHQSCYDEREAAKTQEEKDFDNLMEYCSQLYGRLFDFPRTMKLAKSYHEKNNLSYSGMIRTMQYVYEVQKEPIEKGNGSIGIVPYKYDEAYRYFYSIWEANQRAKHDTPKILEKYEPKVIRISIPVPERKVKKKSSFSFLDLDKEDNNEQ